MTPREKANELYSKYDDLLNKDFIPIVFDNQLKQCALIAVDEMMMYSDFHLNYLDEVKQEIQNL